MNTLITEKAVQNHLTALNNGDNLPVFLNIPFNLDSGKIGNYKIKSGIDRLNKFLKQLKTASKYCSKKTNRINCDAKSSGENTIKNQAVYYADNLKTNVLLFYPLKASMSASSNQFRLEVLRLITRNGGRHIMSRGMNATNELNALTSIIIDMGYSIKEYID